MITPKKIVLVCFLSLFIQAQFAVAGGGWPQKKKKGFFKLNQSVISASRFFNPNGEVIDITTISLYTTSLYGEYGITDRFTAIAYVPFFVRSTLNETRNEQTNTLISPGDELNAVGDMDIGIKYGLTPNNKYATSLTLLLGLPIGETQGGDSQILQTGDGEFNQLIMFDIGRGYNTFYMNAGVGFNNRTNNFSDEFRYTFEIGYTGIKNLVATLKVNGVESFNNGDNMALTGNGVFANNTEYFAYGPEISYAFKDKYGISGTAFFAFSGRRILAAPNLGIGVFLKL